MGDAATISWTATLHHDRLFENKAAGVGYEPWAEVTQRGAGGRMYRLGLSSEYLLLSHRSSYAVANAVRMIMLLYALLRCTSKSKFIQDETKSSKAKRK